MIRRVLLTILFFITFFAQSAFSREIFKITSVNFDTSNALILLTSPDNTLEPVAKNIKTVVLSNPKRVYFDLDWAVLTTPAQNWYFNTGNLKQIKVSQFSSEPAKVRVVMYFEDSFDPKKVAFFKINNNIVIKLKDAINDEEYFQPVYTEETASMSDFYENLTISDEDASKVQIAVNTSKSDDVMNQIQQAFNSSIAPPAALKPVSAKIPDGVKKDLKLKSKYYLSEAYVKPDGILISGFGSLCVEKPLYLTSPARVVFDVPNAVVNPEIRNREIKISETESLKIGQFDRNKARIVITSDALEKYVPIFSSDGQSLLITPMDKVNPETLFDKTTDAVSYFTKSLGAGTEEFIVAFNSPLVHSVKRDYSKLTVYMYNALRYNDENFKKAIKSTGFDDMEIQLIPKVGLKLVLPLEKTATVNTYMGADGKSLKVIIKGLKKQAPAPVQRVRTPGSCKAVIDAGHGGSDYGAIRSGINEKDINLDVAKRIQTILASKGASVEMTRQRDETVSLEARTMFSAEKDPDVFVSVHVNSSVRPEIKGIETHYYHPESLELARTIHSSLVSHLRTTDRGLFKSKFYVINHTEVPAVLVEIGFISNEQERAELVSEKRKQQTAEAIAEGILRYLKK